MIEVSHGKLTELMLDSVLARDAKALRVKSQELVRGKQAKIPHTMRLRVREEEAGEARSSGDFIYPTEYEPPELPSSFSTKIRHLRGKPEYKSPEEPNVPTAFETENIGEEMSARVTVDRQKGAVAVVLDLELTRNMGVVEWGKWKTPGGNEFAAGMPEFEVLKSALRLDVLDGGYALAGVLRRESDPKNRIMVFVRCDVLEPEVE